jgi:acyl-CoA thioesterase
MTRVTLDLFPADTASTPSGDGVRELTVSDRWNTPVGTPNGGYVLATMLRGLGEELGSDQPLVAAISYLAPARPGPALLRTSTLRTGRRLSTGTAELVSGDRTTAHLVASFGERAGTSLELGSAPDLAPPDECLDPFGGKRPGAGLMERVEYRMPHQGAGGAGDPTYRLWQRMAGERVPDLFALAFLVDSCPPPVLEVSPGGSVTVQLTVHLHRVPVTPWVATVVSTRHVAGGYHEEDCELWDEEGNLLAQSRQLGILL